MSFDRLAPHYRWMEALLAGGKLHRCRTAFLDNVPVPENILLPGEGNGRCLVECRRRYPDARITCLDASARMLEVARNAATFQNLKGGSVEFIHGNLLNWTSSSNSYDLIITNFFLDCFPAHQLKEAVAILGRVGTSNANWLISDFQLPSSGIKRVRSRLILASMYAFFCVVTRLPARKLTKPDPYLMKAGFNLNSRIELEWSLLHSDWWQRLQ